MGAGSVGLFEVCGERTVALYVPTVRCKMPWVGRADVARAVKKTQSLAAL